MEGRCDTELRRSSAALLHEAFNIFRELLVIGRKLLVLQPGNQRRCSPAHPPKPESVFAVVLGKWQFSPVDFHLWPQHRYNLAQRQSRTAGRVPEVVVKFW